MGINNVEEVLFSLTNYERGKCGNTNDIRRNTFCSMNNEELRELQASLLEIMDEIDSICRKNKIRYSLSSGSLLGAVRHKGIIPWDDDIDVCMLRTDYDRFFDLCKTELGERFGMITIENKEDYGYGFSKIVLHGTKIKQIGLKEGQNVFEVWVDVFPYDHVPSSKLKRFFHKYYNYYLIKLLEERYDGIYGDTGIFKRLCFSALHMINKYTDADKAKRKLIKNMKKYNNEESMYITSLSGFYKYEKEILPKDFFDKLSEYKFSGRTYYGFANYDYYLQRLYGNYMKLPPEEKRHTHNVELVKQ